jgi:pilus assembly protein CpaF
MTTQRTQSWAGLLQPNAMPKEDQDRILTLVTEQLRSLPLDVIRDRKQLREYTMGAVTNAAATLGIALSPEMTAVLTSQATALAGGLGFLDDLLPPNRNDLAEIMLNPDGQLWLLPKGAQDPVPYDYRPSLDETWRAVEALLAPIGRSVSEAVGSVDAKLPRMAGMGGARIKIIHPRLAPGSGFPSINVRLFEPKPVTLEQLLAWEVAPQEVLEGLLKLVHDGYRIMISGGTVTGKTTMLSAIANGIPKDARVVKIEDPEEIWLDHPNVVTLEARPPMPDLSVQPFTVRDGVDAALRMSPRWLIVGEVRTGDVAMSLFRAQMSDHPGLTTFHATSPEHAIHRMALIMFADRDIRFQAAKEAFAAAVDIIVQIGYLGRKRKVLGIWGVHDQLKGGDVKLEPLWISEGYTPVSDAAQRAKLEAMAAALTSGSPKEAAEATNG